MLNQVYFSEYQKLIPAHTNKFLKKILFYSNFLKKLSPTRTLKKNNGVWQECF